VPSDRVRVRPPHLAALAAGAIGVLGACGGGEAPAVTTTATSAARSLPTASAPELCGRLRVRVAGHVRAPEATELSGLVASTAQKGVLWSHNDSGDRARLFALRTDGSLIASLDVPGAEAVDWEDIAVGPDDTLLVGDIGDNGASRSWPTGPRRPRRRRGCPWPTPTAPTTPRR
jgi:hypothetical protein